MPGHQSVSTVTSPPPVLASHGEAMDVARSLGPRLRARIPEAERLRRLRDSLLRNLARRVPRLRVTGDLEQRLPGSLNLSFAEIPALTLIAEVPSIAISTGSACTSASVEPSYVLRALGLPETVANASIRIGLGRFTTAAEADFAADALAAAASRLTREGGIPT